jgi:hypothetical protein
MELNSSIRSARPFFSTSPLITPFSGYSSHPQPGGRLPAPRPSVGPSLPPLHLAFKQSTPSLSSCTLVLDTKSSLAVFFISQPPSPSLSPFCPSSTVLPGVNSPPLFGFPYPLSFGTALQSSRKCTRSEGSISIGDSRSSSAYWMRYSFRPIRVSSSKTCASFLAETSVHDSPQSCSGSSPRARRFGEEQGRVRARYDQDQASSRVSELRSSGAIVKVGSSTSTST